MTSGRTRRVRQKKQTGQEAGTELNLNVNNFLDLVVTGTVSAVVSTLVAKSLNNNDG